MRLLVPISFGIAVDCPPVRAKDKEAPIVHPVLDYFHHDVNEFQHMKSSSMEAKLVLKLCRPTGVDTRSSSSASFHKLPPVAVWLEEIFTDDG